MFESSFTGPRTAVCCTHFSMTTFSADKDSGAPDHRYEDEADGSYSIPSMGSFEDLLSPEVSIYLNEHCHKMPTLSSPSPVILDQAPNDGDSDPLSDDYFLLMNPADLQDSERAILPEKTQTLGPTPTISPVIPTIQEVLHPVRVVINEAAETKFRPIDQDDLSQPVDLNTFPVPKVRLAPGSRPHETVDALWKNF